MHGGGPKIRILLTFLQIYFSSSLFFCEEEENKSERLFWRMGVPAFFRWITAKYPKILVPVIEDSPMDVDGVKMEVSTVSVL